MRHGLLLSLLATAAWAEPPPGHLPPPPGPYLPAPVRVSLAGGACEVTLAHWYTVRLSGDAEGRIVIPLRWHPASGTVSLRGPRGDEMAVEGLTCGPIAALYAAGTRLPFRRLAERAAAAAQAISCTTTGGHTDCVETP